MRISDFTKLTPEDLKEQERFNKMLEDEEKRYTLDGDSDDIGNDIPEDLVLVNGIPYINSRTIANQIGKTEKDGHSDILKKIRNIIKKLDKKDVGNISEMSFKPIESTYLDKYNRNTNCYLLPKNFFIMFIMGYNSDKAFDFKIAYIEKFELMERTLNNISKVISDVQNEEKNIAIMEIKNHIDSYESENKKLMKKLSEASLFHKKELEFKDVVIGELQDKVKTYSSIEEAIDNLSNGAMSITMSNTMKDKILLVY